MSNKIAKGEAKGLEKESQNFLVTGRRTKYGYRTATYKPTLETFRSTTFSDYIRGVCMGVPLENVKSEEAYFENSEEESLGEPSTDGEANNKQESSEEKIQDTASKSNQKTETKEDGTVVKKEVGVNTVPKINIKAEQRFIIVSSYASDALTRDGAGTLPQRIKGDTNMENKTEEGEHSNKEGDTSLTRSRSRRSRNKAKTNDIYSKDYQYQYQIPPKRKLRKKRPRPPPLEPDSVKLSDGIAKITPPEGWWDKAGIGKDTTGRGKPWRKGQKLGDMIIPSPIKQHATGMGGVYDFTMMELPATTVAEWRKRADDYRFRQLRRSTDPDTSDDHMDALARKFWRRLGPTMESSQYGADMEGSLFEGADACGWNVDRLESCLGLLDGKLPGVTSAYLYFGMWGSVFSAHTEDMNLCSINYLHAGAPKYWYAIAQEDSERFESLMASMFPRQNSLCGDFLRHKRSLLSPKLLKDAGIPYTTQVQRAGDIMITFPGSYHFGFNTGFNVAESTNFAVPEWLPFGEQARICMCHPHSVRIDMDQFKSLLEDYQDDMLVRKDSGERELSYSEWIAEHGQRKKTRKKKASEMSGQHHHSKTWIVEVTTKVAIKKGKKGKKKKTEEKEEPRMAKPMTMSRMLIRTPVICLLESAKGNDFYSLGKIVDIVDGHHAKIHFRGSKGTDDIWLTMDSGKLFLDGGPADDECED